MKFKKKHWLLILLVCVLAASIYAYREYNRKAADLMSVKPFASIEATSLIAMYETDEQKANTMYLGKPIDVTGAIAEVDNQQDTLANVMLGKSDDMHKVSCLLDPKSIKELKKYKTGDKITLRGICTGYLMDVELNRCVVIK